MRDEMRREEKRREEKRGVERRGEERRREEKRESAGLVHAVVSEDMDTLTFGAPVMLRNLFQARAIIHGK
jgi:hypothetical protein